MIQPMHACVQPHDICHSRKLTAYEGNYLSKHSMPLTPHSVILRNYRLISASFLCLLFISFNFFTVQFPSHTSLLSSVAFELNTSSPCRNSHLIQETFSLKYSFSEPFDGTRVSYTSIHTELFMSIVYSTHCFWAL